MGNSLSERIAAKQMVRKASAKSVNKAAFLALKNDIGSALADGWSIKLVWETLVEEGKISFSYKTFCGYVARLIAAEKKPSMQENTKDDEKAKSKAKTEIRALLLIQNPTWRNSCNGKNTYHTAGKGGVGKSFISATTAQYKQHKGHTPLCIDTDPINSTFHGFKALNVDHIQVMSGDEINPRLFDALIEKIAATTNDVVIDNGASSFVPLSHYLISNQVPTLLQS
ncbi:traL protein [Legionella israelensis]|nr:traL protein [Legionella israelensis]